MAERAGHACPDVLNECASKSYVEKLRTPADCECGLFHLARRVYKRYFSLIATGIHGTEALVRSLAVKRGVDVLTSRKEKAVNCPHDASRRCRRCKGWN